MSAGPGELTVSGASGSWSLDLHAHRRHPTSEHTARWLRRGLAGTLLGLGAGVTALALNLPGEAPAQQPTGPVAGPSAPQQHTEVVPPVVRTLTVGTNSVLSRPGGTP
jgi:hypothetical protein